MTQVGLNIGDKKMTEVTACSCCDSKTNNRLHWPASRLKAQELGSHMFLGRIIKVLLYIKKDMDLVGFNFLVQYIGFWSMITKFSI